MTEEISVKIVSKDRKKWLDFKEKVNQSLSMSQMDIIVNEKLLELCETKLNEFPE